MVVFNPSKQFPRFRMTQTGDVREESLRFFQSIPNTANVSQENSWPIEFLGYISTAFLKYRSAVGFFVIRLPFQLRKDGAEK